MLYESHPLESVNLAAEFLPGKGVVEFDDCNFHAIQRFRCGNDVQKSLCRRIREHARVGRVKLQVRESFQQFLMLLVPHGNLNRFFALHLDYLVAKPGILDFLFLLPIQKDIDAIVSHQSTSKKNNSDPMPVRLRLLLYYDEPLVVNMSKPFRAESRLWTTTKGRQEAVR
jgi:hypothetical protein